MSRLRDIIRREPGDGSGSTGTSGSGVGPMGPADLETASVRAPAAGERLAHPLNYESEPTDARGKLPWLESSDEAFDDESVSDAPLIARKWLVLGGLAFLALLSAVAFAVYSRANKAPGTAVLSPDSTVSADDPRIPLIEAPKTPIREAPADTGGLAIADQDKTIYDVADGQVVEGPSQMASPAEQPVPRDAIPAPIPALVPAPVPTPVPALAAAPVPAKPKIVPAKPVAAAEPMPIPPLVAEAPKPAPKLIPAKAAPDAEPAKPGVAASGGIFLQLGAFSSRDRAQAAWTSMAGKYGLGTLTSDIVEAGGTFKLRAGPVGSTAKARSICASLTAAGQGCFIAK